MHERSSTDTVANLIRKKILGAVVSLWHLTPSTSDSIIYGIYVEKDKDED